MNPFYRSDGSAIIEVLSTEKTFRVYYTDASGSTNSMIYKKSQCPTNQMLKNI